MSSRVYASIPAGAGVTRSSRRTAFEDTWSSQTIGCAIRLSKSSGTESTTASRSAFCSATAFGTSSPSTTETYVRSANAMRKLTVPESGGSIRSEIKRLADGADEDREDRDPELRRADEAHGLVHQAKRDAGAAPALERPLLEAGSTRRDQRVLRRHEHRAPEHEQEHDHDAESDAHGPRRAPILGGISSPSDQAGSIGNGSVGPVPPRGAFVDEPLEVRQRLGDREPPARGRKLRTEESERERRSPSAARHRAGRSPPRAGGGGVPSARARVPPGSSIGSP